MSWNACIICKTVAQVCRIKGSKSVGDDSGDASEKGARRVRYWPGCMPEKRLEMEKEDSWDDHWQGQKGQSAGEVYPKSKGKPPYKRSHLEREKEFDQRPFRVGSVEFGSKFSVLNTLSRILSRRSVPSALSYLSFLATAMVTWRPRVCRRSHQFAFPASYRSSIVVSSPGVAQTILIAFLV